ncbi:GIY-YIG nuclease family protein [Oleidesulfovibrio sp.]|uniref:GIY-YIG nuclease family protein n=1 Tax=Oleidesulfovibrio sp. TaxID=2909707 RepID=UPI003A855121
MDWVVYLLACADGTQYCGVTTDMDRRLDEHNRGCGAKYTRARRPVSLIVSASFPDRSTAQRVEWKVKRQPSGKKRTYLLQMAEEFRNAAALP